jgi:uncharacterized protein YxjI
MRGRRARRGGVAGGPAAAPAQAAAGPAGAPVGAVAGTRFQMRERLFTIRDRYYIEDDRGQRHFEIDGKLLRVRDTLAFKDMQGHDLYKIQEKVARVRDTMEISRADDSTAAVVHNALVTPLRDRFKIDVPGGGDLVAQGNILQHEYRFDRGRQTVAQVSKRWFRIRDTYGVEVLPGEDAALILAITVVIDMMAAGK